MKKVIRGKWIDEMVGNVGQYISIETSDGMVREGRLSGMKSRELELNGKPVEILTELELNGDLYDTIPLERIARINVL